MQPFWSFLNNPRRMGGILGVLFIVLFLVGGPVLQGEVPTTEDSAQEIRDYWVDDGDRYLAGDFVFGVAVVLFFVPFVAALRSALAPADKSGGMWARAFVAGALIAVILGGAGAAPSGGLAIDGAEGVDDSTLLFATRAGAYSFSGLGLGFALMLIGAAVIILQGATFWRWLGILAALAAVANVVGALWIPDGDQDGVFGTIGFIGLIATLVWVGAVSVQMLLPGERAMVVQPAS